MQKDKDEIYEHYLRHFSTFLPTRVKKAEKILAVLRKHLGQDLSSLRCLDIGSGSGGIAARLANSFRITIGVDVDPYSVRYGVEHYQVSGLHQFVGSGSHLPFPDSSFDVVISNHVYEHVDDPASMIEEIYRVLCADGVCYFAADNKYVVIEPHHHLPFLSWLPRWLANRYLRWTQQEEAYNKNLLSYGKLRRLVSRFRVVDYTLDVVRNPEKFSAEDVVSRRTRAIAGLLGFLKPLLPAYIWVLEKAEG